MSFVIKRKSDGKFGRGRTRYDAEFVDDIQQARVFTEKSHATNSMRQTFATRGNRHARSSEVSEALGDLEIMEVSIVAKAWMDQAKSYEEDSRWLGHLENAGVDNWEGISFAYELQREAGEGED